MKKVIKKTFKSEKGSVTIFVVASMLFITAVIIMLYFSATNKLIKQNKEIDKIKDEYQDPTRNEMDQAYEKVKNGRIEPGEKAEETTKDNYTDSEGNKATIPGGFTVSGIESEQKIAEGLVIYDIPEGETPNWTEDTNSDGVADIQTKYNQFVWIPIETESEYQRDFKYPSYYDEELENTPADSTVTDIGYLPKGIQPVTDDGTNNENAERESVLKYKGFYIGRYEAGKDTDETTVVSKQNAKVWAMINQTDSKEKAKTMYNNSTVKSALCSGIQWDMVMHFVDQKKDATGKSFDVRVADQTRHPENRGEAGKNKNDKVQNIYDLEGNCYEWVSEKNNTSSTFVYRGGDYYYFNYSRASERRKSDVTAVDNISFRTVLYMM